MEENHSFEPNALDSNWKYYAPTILTRQMVMKRKNPGALTVYGPLTITPDILVEEIEGKINEITVHGPLDYPAYLEETIRPKINQVIGPIRSYPADLSDRVVLGQLVLDIAFLEGLEDGIKLAILGALRIPQVLPNELITRKLEALYVSNGIYCREENQAVLARLLTVPRKMTVTPSDYELFETPLVLDRTALESLSTRNLQCTERVQINPEVEPELFDKKIDSILCSDTIFCPTELLEILYRKCNWHETRVADYSGELWIIDDIRELPLFGLQALEGKATLVVFGELSIDPAIDSQLLIDKLFKVHNLGLIVCEPEQKAALNSLLGLRLGEILEYSELE